MNQTLIIGARLPAERLVEASAGRARAWRPPGAGDEAPGSSAGLARLLVELERELERDRPGRVLLADHSDVALAAAIVAAKLLIAVEAADGIAAGGGVNGRLISRLASSYTAQG